MKKFIIKSFALLVTAILSLSLFASCDGDSDWWGTPPYGYTFKDSRLNGYWQLVQYNSDPVDVGNANYMYFNGNGFGYYYYLENGQKRTEQLKYGCQDSVNGASNYQINIQYQYSSPVTMSYWFTHGNDTLWMQWQTGGGSVQTYVYDRINSAPW